MKRTGAKRITVTEDLKQAVAPALRSFDVQFVYVFGSAVTGHLHPESDIDLAVYFDPKLSVEQRFKQLLALYGTLATALSVAEEALDISVLNNASTLLQYVAMSEGVILYERDHNVRVEFELSAMRCRDDERYFRRLSRQAFFQRLAKLSV